MRAVILSLLLSSAAAFAQDDVRFTSIEVFLNSPSPVAAWQFELIDKNGAMKVVGVENGESDAFAGTPYYDREAVQLGSADKIVVADFSLREETGLPSGVIRIATLHLMISGTEAPDFDLSLITANRRDGQLIDASISLVEPRGNEQ